MLTNPAVEVWNRGTWKCFSHSLVGCFVLPLTWPFANEGDLFVTRYNDNRFDDDVIVYLNSFTLLKKALDDNVEGLRAIGSNLKVL